MKVIILCLPLFLFILLIQQNSLPINPGFPVAKQNVSDQFQGPSSACKIGREQSLNEVVSYHHASQALSNSQTNALSK